MMTMPEHDFIGETVLIDRRRRAMITWDVLASRFSAWLWVPATARWVLVADCYDEDALTIDKARTAAAAWWQAHPVDGL